MTIAEAAATLHTHLDYPLWLQAVGSDLKSTILIYTKKRPPRTHTPITSWESYSVSYVNVGQVRPA